MMTRAFFLGSLVLVSLLLLLPTSSADGGLRVAVLEFDNASASRELDALGKGLQSMLTTDLSQVPALQLIERARLSDLQAELKLGKSGHIDPKSAARLGKLAGATHLLVGTFTVVGERMRLDCRLLSVEGGKVLLAEKNEGEKDAFFELEKTLVSRLVPALGVTLKPKERAELARVHTADFEAFRSFSQGVALFDEKKYQEAVAALRDATGRDKDFKLAQLTLSGYEQLIDKLRSQTSDLRSAEDEVKRLEKLRLGSAEAQGVEKLWEITRKKGHDPYDRLAALYELATAYADIGNTSDQPRLLRELRKTEDRFAMKRTGDALCLTYYTEALPLFPAVPPIITGGVRYARGVQSDPARVMAGLKETRKNLLELGKGARGDGLRQTYLLSELSDPEGSLVDGMGFMGNLLLDYRQAADFRQKLLDLGQRLPAPPEELKAFKKQVLQKLGKAYRLVLDLDRSTASYTRAGQESGDAAGLSQATREIELNRDLAKLLSGPAPRELREYLQLKLASQPSYADTALREASKLLVGAALSPQATYALTELRRFPHGDEHVFIGAVPAWALIGTAHLGTGPRSEPLRAGEIRYHRAVPRSTYGGAEPPDSVLVLGAQPGRDVDLKMEVSFVPPSDFWPKEARPRRETGPAEAAPIAQGRPEIGVLYGLRDLSAGEEVDAKTGEKRLRALRGGLLLVKPDAVVSAELVETERKGWGRESRRTLSQTTKAEQRADAGGATLSVSVRVSGGTLEATVGNKSYRFKTLSESGFVAILFRGVGYAAVRKLSAKVSP